MTEPHAITRARERYGLELTVEDLRIITDTYKTEGIKVANQTEGTTIWMLKVKGKVCRVAVSSIGTVKTFLPANHRLRKSTKRLKTGKPRD